MLGKLTDKKLLDNTQALVKQERLTLEKILEHLQEIQRRRLYCDLSYSSLFKLGEGIWLLRGCRPQTG